MQILSDDKEIKAHRIQLMQYLNEQGLDAQAILSISRRSEATRYESGEPIMTQGEKDPHVSFLLTGKALVRLNSDNGERILGERDAISVLGEISYFNETPASATVEVAPGESAVVMRLTYDQFGEVIGEYPQVREVLTRIGDMRLISQYNGFTSYKMFMDMIGWRRDRFAINRTFMPKFEETLKELIIKQLGGEDRLLEVGDGPGIVSEILMDENPDLLKHLYIQAAKLEDAIAVPHIPLPSDFRRAQYLQEEFAHIVALQVFNTVPPSRVDQQYKIAARLLPKGGHLFMVKLRMLNVNYTVGNREPELLFSILERLVESTWPNAAEGKSLIDMTFLDADLDPLMEWNKIFGNKVKSGEIELPAGLDGEERVLLGLLFDQAKHSVFDPDEIHFEWLSWKGSQHGLELQDSEHRPEIGYFYHLFRKS